MSSSNVLTLRRIRAVLGIIAIVAMMLALATGGIFSRSAFAQGNGQGECPEGTVFLGNVEGDGGTITTEDGEIVVTFDGAEGSFTGDVEVAAVVVKAGQNFNIIEFDPAVTEGEFASESGQDVSNVTFCGPEEAGGDDAGDAGDDAGEDDKGDSSDAGQDDSGDAGDAVDTGQDDTTDSGQDDSGGEVDTEDGKDDTGGAVDNSQDGGGEVDTEDGKDDTGGAVDNSQDGGGEVDTEDGKDDTGGAVDNSQDGGGEVDDSQEEGETPSEMPDTGAGGVVGGFPAGPALSLLGLLAAAGGAVVSRRRG